MASSATLPSSQSQAISSGHTMSLSQGLLARICFIVIAMIFIMVGLGGYTRLTGSGLSMVDWRPITGWLPPLSELEWNQVFALYRESPEYLLKNAGMDVNGFKSIFWLEYIHRVWGRLIGIVFFIPVVLTLISPSLRSWFPRFLGIFTLGGLQGAMGWYMVKSGLVNDPEVSPYRLCAHLLLAFLTCACIFWTALNLRKTQIKTENQISFFKTMASPQNMGVGFLILITISYGAFVAGMKAGLVYNTFPMMGEQWIPDETLFYTPWYTNFFMNPVTVQLTHRILAIATAGAIIFYGIKVLKQSKSSSSANSASLKSMSLKKAVMVLKGTVCLQVILGISTLLSHVHIDLAVAHQLTALVLILAFMNVVFIKSAPEKSA